MSKIIEMMSMEFDISWVDEVIEDHITVEEENFLLRSEHKYMTKSLRILEGMVDKLETKVKKLQGRCRVLTDFILESVDAQPPIEIIDLTDD